MTEFNGGRPCPGCGATVDTQYCPHCGSRTLPVDEPVFSGRDQVAPDDASTLPSLPAVPRSEGPARAVPEMFPTEMVPAAAAERTGQAWSQAPDPGRDAGGPQTGLFPGWTGMHPAVVAAGAKGALAPSTERRRKAIYAVAGIAAATVLVLLAALLIAPHLGSNSNVADMDGQPVAVSTPPSSSGVPSTAPSTAAGSNEATPSPGTAPAPVAPSTVTVTAAPPRTPATTASPKAPTTVKKTPKPTARPTKPTVKKPVPMPANPLGVPQRDIGCTGGYIVQLASELDAKTFAAHVARLKAGGQLPTNALAADSTRSCKIFSSQRNTVVLYTGPYGSKYAGCAARLAGPADAYIKGGNPANAQEYVSCLCPARTAQLPTVAAVGSRNVWIGELQRVLGSRLNISVGALNENWGVFTPATKSAVAKFQQQQHLPANGVVDARTWKRMQAVGC